MSKDFRAKVKARRCAVQALYQWQFADHKPREIIDQFSGTPELEAADSDYFEWIVKMVNEHQTDLRAEIESCLDRPWEQIDPVERGVLYLGVVELKFAPEIPWRAVINEGVEVCKMFGAEESHKYINGVLDKLAHKIRRAEVSAKQLS